MEIIKLKNGMFQLINIADGTVLAEGTNDLCVDVLAQLCKADEEASYAAFMGMGF